MHIAVPSCGQIPLAKRISSQPKPFYRTFSRLCWARGIAVVPQIYIETATEKYIYVFA